MVSPLLFRSSWITSTEVIILDHSGVAGGGVSGPETNLFRQVQAVFGANVKAKRQALGWTQSYLAERAGLAKWEVTRIEQGLNDITLRTITRLVEELGENVPEMLAPLPDRGGPPPRRIRSIYRD